jgi:hypothetical protein
MQETPAERSAALRSAPAAAPHLADADPSRHVRLLPWTADGKLCILSAGGPDSFLSRLADSLEVSQLDAAHDVLHEADAVLSNPMSPYAELRYAGIRLSECLRDALRVAESRGARIAEEGEPLPYAAREHDPKAPR